MLEIEPISFHTCSIIATGFCCIILPNEHKEECVTLYPLQCSCVAMTSAAPGSSMGDVPGLLPTTDNVQW